jgi:hypothetical protein
VAVLTRGGPGHEEVVEVEEAMGRCCGRGVPKWTGDEDTMSTAQAEEAGDGQLVDVSSEGGPPEVALEVGTGGVQAPVSSETLVGGDAEA